ESGGGGGGGGGGSSASGGGRAGSASSGGRGGGAPGPSAAGSTRGGNGTTERGSANPAAGTSPGVPADVPDERPEPDEIIVRIVDAKGAAVGGVAYELTMPDGSVHTDTADDGGIVHLT